jgi:hypothetical protein
MWSHGRVGADGMHADGRVHVLTCDMVSWTGGCMHTHADANVDAVPVVNMFACLGGGAPLCAPIPRSLCAPVSGLSGSMSLAADLRVGQWDTPSPLCLCALFLCLCALSSVPPCTFFCASVHVVPVCTRHLLPRNPELSGSMSLAADLRVGQWDTPSSRLVPQCTNLVPQCTFFCASVHLLCAPVHQLGNSVPWSNPLTHQGQFPFHGQFPFVNPPTLPSTT